MRLRSPSRTLILLSSVLIPLSFVRTAACPGAVFALSITVAERVARSRPATAPATTEVPPGAEERRRSSGPLPVYGGRRVVEGLQPRHRRDRRLPGRGREERLAVRARRPSSCTRPSLAPGHRRSRTPAPTSS